MVYLSQVTYARWQTRYSCHIKYFTYWPFGRFRALASHHRRFSGEYEWGCSWVWRYVVLWIIKMLTRSPKKVQRELVHIRLHSLLPSNTGMEGTSFCVGIYLDYFLQCFLIWSHDANNQNYALINRSLTESSRATTQFLPFGTKHHRKIT